MKNRIFAAVTAAVMALSAMPFALAEDINETYDDIRFTNPCDTELSGVTLNDGAPDGSSFYTLASDAGAALALDGLDADTSEDYMWQVDMRFDSNASGFTIRDKGRKKVDTCIRRNDVADGEGTKSYIAVRRGNGENDIDNYVEIDTDKWYRIQLIGQYGTSKPLIMQVLEWNDSEWEFKGEYENISKRNNVAAACFDIEAGASFDNVEIIKLGADELTVSTIPEGVTEIKAGASAQMQFSAARNGRDINKPEVEWKVFENDTEITDGSVTVDQDGKVSADKSCGDKNITVKVISAEKGNIEGSYDLAVNAVSFENEKYDDLSLSADNDCVRAGEPLALTVSATKNGEPVTLEDGDVVWSFYDEKNIQEIGNRYITVENNELCVTEQVISQKITVRAENANKTVSAELPVTIKASDAVEIGETGTKDQILVTDACEDVNNEALTSGSWDGSHYYNIANTYDMIGIDPTTEDVIIEADLKFISENSGVKLRDSKNSKEGGQIALQNGKIGRVGSSNKFTAICDYTSDSWYHIEIITRCGSDGSYGKVSIYKYDENGNKVHPDSGEEGKAATGTLELRTMHNQQFAHLQVQSGTGIDNMRVMRLVPDKVEISMSADSVFAGQTMQATFTASRKGVEISAFPASRIKWAIYDENNTYPVTNDIAELISVDANGLVSIDATAPEQTVYVRAMSVDNSEAYGALPLTIKGSDIFTVTGIGINEEGNKITELKVQKDYFYNGDVAFVIAVYDANDVLIDVDTRSLRDNTLAIGENKIGLEVDLPENFDTVKAFIWTSL